MERQREKRKKEWQWGHASIMAWKETPGQHILQIRYVCIRGGSHYCWRKCVLLERERETECVSVCVCVCRLSYRGVESGIRHGDGASEAPLLPCLASPRLPPSPHFLFTLALYQYQARQLSADILCCVDWEVEGRDKGVVRETLDKKWKARVQRDRKERERGWSATAVILTNDERNKEDHDGPSLD